jgi:hypothetical protein
MIELSKVIESGRQIGVRYQLMREGKEYWVGAGIQRYKDKYKVCHYEIFEDDIESEAYIIDKMQSYENLQEAISYLKKIKGLDFELFTPFKGEKLFDATLDDYDDSL